MRRVAIVGGGMTPSRSRWASRNYWDLAQEGMALALQDAKIDVGRVGAVVVGTYNDIFAFQAIPECGFTSMIGMANKRVTRVTNGGATAGHAMQVAYEMIASGEYDIVVFLGVEKALDCFDFAAQSPTPAVVGAIGLSWDKNFEYPNGQHAGNSYAQVELAYDDEHPGDILPQHEAEMVVRLCEQAKSNP